MRAMVAPVLGLIILAGTVPPTLAGDPPAAVRRERLAVLLRLRPDDLSPLAVQAEAGSPQAMMILGEAYGLGFAGLPMDDGLAVQWLDRAARAGADGAALEAEFFRFRAHNAGFIAAGAIALRNGRRIVSGLPPQDDDGNDLPVPEYPDRVLEQLADLGLEEAQLMLGDMYSLGRGASADPLAAAQWYGLAARQGSARAHHALGTALLAQSPPRGSKEWNAGMDHELQAAGTGLPEAQYAVADAMDGNDLAAADSPEAMKWCLLAASGGLAKAKSLFAALEARFGPDAAADAQRRAADWLRAHGARSG